MSNQGSNFSCFHGWLMATYLPTLNSPKNSPQQNTSTYIYICSTAVNLDSIRATLAKHKFDQESIKLVQLHMPSSPELPPHLHTTKNMPSNLFYLCKKKVVCTGPLVADDRNANLDEEALDIMKWLSGKERSSTVYISFGSECFLSKEQIAEIAKGLELCDVNFIWVLRFPAGAGAEEELPAGFIERVGGRGIVVKWAPQTKILAHPSIGAIVSHSGWNSIMESIYFGVPIVGIPMQYEQRFNARLAVEAGAGVEVEKDAGGGYYAGEDVAKGIEKVMREETFREEVRSRAKILREKIRAEEEKEMNEAAEELLRICSNNVRHDT